MTDTNVIKEITRNEGRNEYIMKQERKETMLFHRITVNTEICGGKPCIRGLRFPVSRLLGLLAAGETAETILQAYPYLEPEDIDEALMYAALLADEQVFEFAT